MRLLISAGEASGDAYAAALVQGLHSSNAPFESITGIGGRKLAATGVPLLADSSDWGAIGILEAVRVGPRVYKQSRPMVRALSQGPPGLFIPIDFGYLNVSLARSAKALGWKVLYFAPPGSWRRGKQGKHLPEITDAIVTQFSWSAQLLKDAGANAHWFGHPLKEMLAEIVSPEARTGIAILPGSRTHEVKYNLQAIIPAIAGLPGPFRVAVAASIDAGALRAKWESMGGPTEVHWETQGAARALASSRVAVVCSGTATLEAALVACPSVVVYRGSRLMEMEYRLRKPKFEFIALPNLLMQREVVPELLQHQASPARIRHELDSLLRNPEKQLAAFAELNEVLGPTEGISGAVKLAIDMAQSA
ncbi:MAG: hypothetical protein JNM85_00980 [Chthonomonas sp.]|nr:hypothetical protein [Chthonomonas sp.]